MKHFSILGLTLIAASAVTAAIIPGKPEITRTFPGSLTLNSAVGGGGVLSSITCEADTLGPIQAACTADDDDDGEGSPSETTGVDLPGDDDSTSLSSYPPDGGVGGNNTSDGH